MDVMSLVARLSLDDSQYMSGLGKAVKGLGKFGAAAITAATGAATAFAGSAIKSGMAFDKSMSQVVATMGYSVEELNTKGSEAAQNFQKLSDFAQEMGRTTAFSATESADALNYMALAGYSVEESMSMLPNVLNLAAAGQMDLAKASDMVTDTQTAFGLKMEEMPQLVDEMAKAASTGNTSVEQLGDAFLTIGGLAQELNGGMVELANGTKKPASGIQELEIALTAMANAGIKGSEAGTHMRNMLLKLSSPTSEGTKQLEALGVSVFDSEGKMRSLKDVFGDLDGALGNLTQEQKIQAISDLFNTRDLASAEAILNAVGEDWDEIGASILDAEGAAADMAKTQLDNLAGDITLFKSALEGAQIALSDGMEPALREFVQVGTEGVSEFTEKLKEGDYAGAAQVIGETIGRELRTALSHGGSFVEAGASLLQGLFDGLVGAVPTFTGPLGDSILNSITTSITTKVDGFITMGATMLTGLMDGISQNAPMLLATGGTIIGGLLTSIGENLPALLNKGAEMVGNILKGIAMALPNIIVGGLNLISGLLNGVSQGSTTLFSKFGEILVALGGAIIQALPALGQAMLNLMNALGNYITSVNWLELGKNAFMGLVNALAEVIPEIKATVEQLVRYMLVKLGFAGLAAKVKGAFESVRSAISSKFSSIKSTVSTAVSYVLSKLSFSGAAAKARTAFENIRKAVADKMDAAKQKVKGVIETIKGYFPFSVGKIFSGWIPKIKLWTSKSGDSAETQSSTSSVHFAKAMNQPYLFTRKTLFNQYAGEAGNGGEVLYGKNSLMSDIRNAVGNTGGITINLNYMAGDDANDMVRDMARIIERYRMAGAM